jgi:glycosyltransferase involved in cell wall biosynthesis
MPIAYLIPEFPGQTHTWIWRELAWLRRWGADVRLVSTRPPPARDRAKHAWAAAGETFYLVEPSRPASLVGLAGSSLAFALRRPLRLARSIGLARGLPIDGGHNLTRCLPLLPPALRLAAWCVRQGIRHVHCHTCANGAVIAMLNRELTDIPYSLTINANLEWWGGAMAEKIGGAAFAVSTMRWVQAQARERFPDGVADRVGYAPVGVDTVAWQPPTARRPRQEDVLQLICIGRLHPSKGFDTALRALALLRAVGVAARLTILGEGPERPRLEALVDELDLGVAATMPGSVAEDQVKSRLEAADIFLLPSLAEPLGVVVMEAMSLELPVIVTAGGGVTEIVTPGVDALTVPPGDPARLAAAIRALAADPEERRRLARAGRQSVVAKFDARIGARIMYRQLFGREPPTADPA